MREIVLRLKISPIAKQSVRQGKSKSGKKVFYQEDRYKVWKETTQWQIKAQLPKDWIPFSKQVIVRKLQYCFKSKQRGPKTTRPDLHDNLNKLPFDAMNGLVYADDSLVWKIENLEKVYCEDNEIFIILEGE